MAHFQQSSKGNRFILINVDRFTKWCEVILKNDQAVKLVSSCIISNIVTLFGIAKTNHSDEERQFEYVVISDIFRYFGIKKSRSSAHHREVNGNAQLDIVLGEQPKSLVLDISQHTRESRIARPMHVHVKKLLERLSNVQSKAKTNIELSQSKYKSSYYKTYIIALSALGILSLYYKGTTRINKVYDNNFSEVTQEENDRKTSHFHQDLLREIRGPDISENSKRPIKVPAGQEGIKNQLPNFQTARNVIYITKLIISCFVISRYCSVMCN
ncbi:hypothetical protein RF11_01350 [Thelohanellus kitauei]|uniref:Integrase catalytic domain-containing protein n=1 Tax=Thelohanellus kitauei TaxID=669202 RepID=A0A0C2MWT5_THEKT|nr:hypothetical protein RF11_01350 [Thelohanellus kitauei]